MPSRGDEAKQIGQVSLAQVAAQQHQLALRAIRKRNRSLSALDVPDHVSQPAHFHFQKTSPVVKNGEPERGTTLELNHQAVLKLRLLSGQVCQALFEQANGSSHRQLVQQMDNQVIVQVGPLLARCLLLHGDEKGSPTFVGRPVDRLAPAASRPLARFGHQALV